MDRLLWIDSTFYKIKKQNNTLKVIFFILIYNILIILNKKFKFSKIKINLIYF